MAEPTLKEVLNAISKMEARLDAKIDRVESKMATKADLREEVGGLRTEMIQRFDDLDEELEKHASRAHRDLDARIGRLEKRTAPKKVSARPLRRR